MYDKKPKLNAVLMPFTQLKKYQYDAWDEQQ
ncbi:MAG: hypothetical protein ACI9LY_000110 [Arenicella sp.]|jgi:hypothetical protein